MSLYYSYNPFAIFIPPKRMVLAFCACACVCVRSASSRGS